MSTGKLSGKPDGMLEGVSYFGMDYHSFQGHYSYFWLLHVTEL